MFDPPHAWALLIAASAWSFAWGFFWAGFMFWAGYRFGVKHNEKRPR